jgi:hypothetical protein
MWVERGTGRGRGFEQDAVAGRGPSRLRVNKPRPYKLQSREGGAVN